MSEPLSAFLKFRIDRAKLVRWLDAPVRPASRWSDWRQMGGKYYNVGIQHLSEYSAADLARAVAKCDASLLDYRDNRAALRGFMSTAEEPQLKRATYQADTSDFIAGSLTYAENLIEYLMFYAVVRSVEAVFGADESGIAVIRNYIWGGPEARTTHSAMRLGAGARSEFLGAGELESAGGAFLAMAEEMMTRDPHPPPVVDELDSLR